MKKLAFFTGVRWRRVLLLTALLLLGGIAILQWLGPALRNYQPHLVELLRDKLDLQELHFDHLSWTWTGYTWLTAENLSLLSADGGLRVDDASLAVRIAIWDLLLGKVKVEALRISHPTIDVNFSGQATGVPPAIPEMNLSVVNATLGWQYEDERGRIEGLNARMDGMGRNLLLDTAGASLSVAWSGEGKPNDILLRWQDTRFLPESRRLPLRGDVSGQIQAREAGEGVWSVRAEVRGKGNSAVLDRDGEAILPLGFIELQALVNWPIRGEFIQADIESLHWQAGDRGDVRATANLADGELGLSVHDGRLAMPILWSWLKRLGGEAWRAWLKDMQHGMATELRGSLVLPWQDFGRIPSREQWKLAQYSVHAHVVAADVTLKTGSERLSEVDAIVELDQHGLVADVKRALLPASIGTVGGQLLIKNWKDLALDIGGGGDVDVGKLVDWLGITVLPDLVWSSAPAKGEFSFHWLPGEHTPRQGDVRLQPSTQWEAIADGRQLILRGGEVRWRADQNLWISDMRAAGSGLDGEFDLHATSRDGLAWHLERFEAVAGGDLGAVAAAFHVPVVRPQGEMTAQIGFDGAWRLQADLAKAGWEHFLGSRKKAGEAFTVEGKAGYKGETLRLTSLLGVGSAISFSGSGARREKAWDIDLRLLRTPAFDGALKLVLPLGNQAPIEISVAGQYLDHRFLPEGMTADDVLPSRGWVLRLDMHRVVWRNAELAEAKGKFTSGSQAIGTLQADSLTVANLNVKDVDALLTLPKSGVLDIRRLFGTSWGQRFKLSALVRSDGEAGLAWGGYVHMFGDDFGSLPQNLGWSERFSGGRLQAVLAGSGRLAEGKPWWDGFAGRLRFRVEDGRIAEGGILTRLLSAANLAELPKILVADRKDLIGRGMHFKRLQVEAEMAGSETKIRQLAMRSSALDMAGSGDLDVEEKDIDLILVMRPLQNLDKILGMIPLLRDLLGGSARSLLRKVYHVHGPMADARVEEISPQEAGLANPGLVEALLNLPGRWFGKEDAQQR